MPDNGDSDCEYLGEKAKRASIDRAWAWDCASKFLRKYYDPESVAETLKEDFETAYSDALEDPWWRESKFGGIK